MLAHDAPPGTSKHNVAERTNGVIFLGTPHRGSPFAAVGALVSLFSYWRGARAQLLEYLSSDAQQIQRIHESFLAAYDSIYLASFFEELPVRLGPVRLTEVPAIGAIGKICAMRGHLIHR